MNSSCSVAFIAGDPSGDQHCAAVMAQLSERCPGLKMWGIGGPEMEKQGFTSIMPFAPFNRMGFIEVALNIRFFLGARKKISTMLRLKRPDALVCVDYPGFNMTLLKQAKRLEIPVIWYIAPMVWAWRKRRAEFLGQAVSHIAVIFPFEVQFFNKFKADVTFVGNPISEDLEKGGYTKRPAQKILHPNGTIRLALVPGSRVQEIKSILPSMIRAAELLKTQFPGIEIRISKFAGLDEKTFSGILGHSPHTIYSGSLKDMLKQSDIALVTSGTASLECALMGVPMVIVYRTSALNFRIFRSLVTLPFIGLPNIIAGKKIVSECIQHNATAEILADELRKLIINPEEYEKSCSSLFQLQAVLGDKKASLTVAEIIKSHIKECCD